VKELLWGSRSEAEEPEIVGPEGEDFATYDPFRLPEPSAALDLRGFIQTLADARHLTRVRERVDWKLSIGRWSRSRRKPLLFENVKDYPRQRVFTNGLSRPFCIGLALGFDAHLPYNGMIAQARKRLHMPMQPKIVRTGPVMENVVPASVLDLFQFPVPQWSEYDAGRYLGTWHLNVTKDPETGKRNAGVYRMQVLGPKQATVSASKGSDLARHVAKADAKGMELPMVVAIGAPEATVIAAAAACPATMDEFELAGALQQNPVELLECVHVEVPAHSEILIEGFIHPGARVEDGPYFDYYGRPNINPEAFLFEATRLMHRNDPIFRGSAIGKPGAEDHQLFAFLAQLGLVDFHGSRLKQTIQNFLWKRRAFGMLQTVGRVGSELRRRM
jgi:4-hydroxy-3-polyprenylbenzoate decarboxylase